MSIKTASLSAITSLLVLALAMTSAFPSTAGAATVSEMMSYAFESSPAAEQEFPEIQDVTPAYEMWVLATAYSSDVYQTDSTPCIPAMGSFNLCEHYAAYGIADTIAANDLALGTQVTLKIPGLPELDGKRAVVRDRMNAKYTGKRRIDIWMPSREEAVAFGARRVKIEVYPYR